MEIMPRPRPPKLRCERTRHGSIAWYVRKGDGPRIRIRGEYGSPEFMAAYQAAVAGGTPERAPRAPSGSLAWLIGCYRDSGAWARLSVATRSQRDYIFKHVCDAAGAVPHVRITKKTILAGLERRRQTPFAANDFLKAMRGLFKWAMEAQHVATDPTEGVARCITPRNDGFHTWTEEEIDRFEAMWPVGTRERLAMAILLYTGLRRGDAVRLGKQHCKNDVLTLRTEKGGVQVIIPILPELAAVIAATKTGDLAFVASTAGAPMTKARFGNWFGKACKAAGVCGSAHGLRKAGATRAVENGATLAQLNAIFGWTGEKMAAHYTRSMDRAKLARQAMWKLSK